MKILKINIFQCNTPFALLFRSSIVKRSEANSIIVQLECDNNVSGYGESAPRSYVTGETLTSVTDAMQKHFSKILFNHPIDTVGDIKTILRTLEEVCHEKEIKTYNSALGAIDIALLDVLGKSLNLAYKDLLTPIRRNDIPFSISIPLLPLSKIKELYKHIDGFEFSSVKVLLGNDQNENRKRVDFVRSLLGSDIKICLEVNGAWTTDQAILNIEELRKHEISAIEQPVHKDNFAGLKKIKDSFGIPIIADESMCDLDSAKKLIESNTCDILNIKLSKCGGLLKSREIADYAQTKNIPCVVGTHAGETAILTGAGGYLAATIPNLIYFEGFSPLLFIEIFDKNRKRGKEVKKFFSSNIGSSMDLSSHRLEKICSILPQNNLF